MVVDYTLSHNTSYLQMSRILSGYRTGNHALKRDRATSYVYTLFLHN
jgi:hypothetical protein